MNMERNGPFNVGAFQLTLVNATRHNVEENLDLEKTVKHFLGGTLKSPRKVLAAKTLTDVSEKVSLKKQGPLEKKF